MKIKWGVIGCGGIALRRTILGMMLLENSELIAVMDTNFDAAEKVKEEFGAKHAFTTKAPGMLFRFGTRNEENGCTTTAHCNDFKIDENGMKHAINAFCEYILHIN